MEHDTRESESTSAAAEQRALLWLVTHILKEENRLDARPVRVSDWDLWNRALTVCQVGCAFVRLGYVREDALVAVAGPTIKQCCHRCHHVLDNPEGRADFLDLVDLYHRRLGSKAKEQTTPCEAT
jgi:hypothetical protein